jgi:hypothetical protein
VTGREFQIEIPHYHRQDDDGFLDCESCANADARPRAERQIRETVNLLTRTVEEAGWIENFGFWP